MTSNETAQTASKWFQGKRVPLYIVVGGSLLNSCTKHLSPPERSLARKLSTPQPGWPPISPKPGAGLYLSSRSKHPHVESSTNLRKDPVPEERSSMPEEGAAHKESVGRRTTRQLGLFEGQNSDGILPNNKIVKKIGDIAGQNDMSAPRGRE